MFRPLAIITSASADQPSDEISYRSDIDGLRAIAVLLVIAFHFFPRRVPGGFVGVDIFFVISGFLISSVIRRGLIQDTFTFTDFYLRRMRRIVPALAAVLVACIIGGWLLLFATEYVSLGKHVAAGAAFVSNFVLLNETGYFDRASELKPLLHLWSLAIEEQFYLIWPVIVVITWRYTHATLSVAGIILVISFISNLWLSTSDTAAAFYLPATRFWELMVGCLLAFAGPVRNFIERGSIATSAPGTLSQIREVAAWAGIASIACAAAVAQSRLPYPGWIGLLPTVGTAALIVAGPYAWINQNFLSLRWLVYVGLISYPLYLWHWPLLAFLRNVYLGEPKTLLSFGFIALAFALAHLTYVLVERPIRFGTRRRLAPIFLSLALLLAGISGAVVYSHEGFPERYGANVQTAVRKLKEDDSYKFTFSPCVIWLTQRTQANECAAFFATPPTRLVLWGDSHAGRVYPGLMEIAGRRKTVQVAGFGKAACPPILEFRSEIEPGCPVHNREAIGFIERMRPDVVVMSGFWGVTMRGKNAPETDAALRNTIKQIKLSGVRRIIGIGQFPVWMAAPERIVGRIEQLQRYKLTPDAGPANFERNGAFVEPYVRDVDEFMRKIFVEEGAEFISPLTTFCNDDGCLLTVPNSGNMPVSSDVSHLTNTASVYFASKNEIAFFGPRSADR
jgi:peptidoglycan/LPS O-acetylase OafA/YrhL